MDNLHQELATLDKMLPEQFITWLEHREKYSTKLAAELKQQQITLTGEERSELLRAGSTANSIKEKTDTLEKLKIKLPAKPSDFVIAVYDALTAAFSRTLQKIDNDSIKNIVKKLTAISAEDDDAQKIKKLYEKHYEEVKNTISDLKNKTLEIELLPDDQ